MNSSLLNLLIKKCKTKAAKMNAVVNKATVDSCTNTWLNRSTQILERLHAFTMPAPFRKKFPLLITVHKKRNCSWRVSLSLNANEKMGNFYGIAN